MIAFAATPAMCCSSSFQSAAAAKTLNPPVNNGNGSSNNKITKLVIICARDRGKNRKQLQRGRNLSIEAIQTLQALKRAPETTLDTVFESKFKRLLKLDMVSVLKELIRQNQPLLALKVFEDVRKEYWYKPQVLIYADMIEMLASNNLFEKIELLLFYLRTETHYLDVDSESFNALFGILIDNGFTAQAMEQFQLMKELQCELNESTFRILVKGLESKGETHLSSMLRQEAEKYFRRPLEFIEEEVDLSCD